MTTNEGVLRRWSRRKQAAKVAPPPSLPEHDATLAAEPNAPLPGLPPAELPPPELPPPELPPIESLDIASDYTAFLQKGVTAEVQRLALQRAWQSDERIASFRGMAEYAWDFNKPDYGRLWAADDVLKLVQDVLTPPSYEPPSDDPPLEQPPVADAPVLPAEDAALLQQADAAADGAADGAADPAHDPVATAEPAADRMVRRHGSALPG